MAGSIHIGTSGWSYKHWKESIYPPQLKSTEWLTWYSRYFSASEINTCFYHLPKPATIRGWMDKVPETFLFCPKISRYLTHIKRLIDPEEPLEKFFELFEPMKKRLGPVLVQLPPRLPFQLRRVEHFYTLLKQKYSDYSFAVEVRDERWLQEESIGLMRKYQIAFVISQSGGVFPYAEQVTARNVYLRFHGPGQLYASLYQDVTLQSFAVKMLDWKAAGHRVWAFFNNDVHGYAWWDAQKLIALTTKK